MKIGFIGCGNMASAMISGMLKKGLYKKDEIIVSNLTEEDMAADREEISVLGDIPVYHEEEGQKAMETARRKGRVVELAAFND